MNKSKAESHWVSLSDMMSGLMMVFLFIAVLFMHQLQQQQKKQEDMQRKILVEYKNAKENIYEELNERFKDRFNEWEMELGRDLTIKFTNPDVLFARDSAVLTPKFKTILTEFVPEYLEVISKEEYSGKISEVRIEGHTADWDNYMYTIKLSQERANSVLEYVLGNPYYKKFSEDKQEEIKFWLTANGLGRGRALDEDGNFVFESHKKISSISRRVEFKIVTTSSELIDQVIKNTFKEN